MKLLVPNSHSLNSKSLVQPAYALVAIANKLNIPFEFSSIDAPTLQSNSDAISGSFKALRFFSHTEYAKDLGIVDHVSSCQIDSWLDFLLKLGLAGNNLSEAFRTLDVHLRGRSFLVGYSVTLADLAAWGTLRAIPIFVSHLKSSENDLGDYVRRWYNYLETLDCVKKTVEDFEKNQHILNKSKKDQGSFEIGLKDAEMGKVVTRFPPEASGYLHIGHAKAALLNEYFASRYEGTLILRFDDTNPTKEKAEFEDSIREDLVLLGITPHKTSHTSDYFQTIYEYAIKLIDLGLAYVDDSPQETMQSERLQMIESKARLLSIQENHERFDEMKKGTAAGLHMCLRAKIDMKSPNGTMRDPVIYRTNLTPHLITKDLWKMYPTYDFACPIVDSIEGVTHALRSNEYRDRNVQYEWFLNALSLRFVHVWDFSRVNFVYTLLSKRKLAWFVEKGLVNGWDDPRFPTVRGIRRRGMTIQALREYILMQGASQKILEMEWDKIWTLNKKVIDPIAPRHTSIACDGITKVKVCVSDSFESYVKEMPKHKKNPDVGTKITFFANDFFLEYADAKDLSVGEEVTLMDWGNVIIEKLDMNPDTNVLQVQVKLHLDGDFKKTKKKLTWLAQASPAFPDNSPVNVTLFDFDYIITKKKLEEDDNFSDFVTKTTEFRVEAIGDSNLRFCKKGDIIQLERKGYYIVDKAFNSDSPSEKIHLFFIPDGRVASIMSKSAESAPAAKSAKKNEMIVQSTMYESKAVYDSVPAFPKEVGQMYTVKPFYTHNFGVDAKAATAEKSTVKVKDVKAAKVEKPDKSSAKSSTSEVSIISKLDIVVGKIIDVQCHPDADSLYVEQIDVGEATPRTVVSGLRKFMAVEDMQDKLVLVLKNLKPANMRGVKSHAMVLCASSADGSIVEFLIPPESCKPGDRVYFPGHEGEPEEQLAPKKKVFETVQPDFKTRQDLVAVWKDVAFTTSSGPVKTRSLVGASIK